MSKFKPGDTVFFPEYCLVYCLREKAEYSFFSGELYPESETWFVFSFETGDIVSGHIKDTMLEQWNAIVVKDDNHLLYLKLKYEK
jgi:hypothetical protein